MAQEPFGERTERATPRRRQEARREGQVARSAELTGAIALIAALLALVVFGPRMLESMGDLMRTGLSGQTDSIETTQGTVHVMRDVGGRLIWTVAPLLASLMAIGLFVNILQVGFLFTTKPLSPQLSKLDPIKGFGRIFGRKGVVELLKAIAKVSAVGIVAFSPSGRTSNRWFHSSEWRADGCSKRSAARRCASVCEREAYSCSWPPSTMPTSVGSTRSPFA